MATEAGYLIAPKGKVPTLHCSTFKEAKQKAKEMAPSVIIEVSTGIFQEYIAEVVERYGGGK